MTALFLAIENGQVTLLDCEKQSRLPGNISAVDLKANLKEELHNRHVAARCGMKEGCLSMDILDPPGSRPWPHTASLTVRNLDGVVPL